MREREKESEKKDAELIKRRERYAGGSTERRV